MKRFTLLLALVSVLSASILSPSSPAIASGSTYPTYDGTVNASEWTYGLLDFSGTLAFAYLGATGTDERWLYKTMLLNLQPGDYLLEEFKAIVAYTSDTQCDVAYFAILKDTSGTLTPVTLSNGLGYIDITADKGADVTHLMTADLGDVTVTLETGSVYHMALFLRGKAGRTTAHPGLKSMGTAQGPQGSCYSGEVAGATFPASITDTADAGSQARFLLKFKTGNRILYSGAYSAAAQVLIPKSTDKDYWVTFSPTVVADGQAFTCVLSYDNDSNAAARTTMVLDLGATDQVTFGGANVALAAAAAEAGDAMYLGVNVRPVTGKMDLFYQNRTTGQGAEGAADFTTISHACKNGAARDAEYTVAAPSFLNMSGTATVTKLEVGWGMAVMFGDSQCSSASSRLATHLPTSFEHPRQVWHAWISGNQLMDTVNATHTAGYLRWKHGTPGLGDLCEMTGTLFVWGGFGVNDVSNDSDTRAERNGFVMGFASRVATILQDAANKGCSVLVIGLPPYSDGNANTHEAKTIQLQLNPALEGLAVGCQGAYTNPWYRMVSGSQSADVPAFAAGYTEDGGLHYNSAGAAIVADGAAKSVESAIVGGWWSNPARRYARSKGLLLP
jgi:hypothetical protein